MERLLYSSSSSSSSYTIRSRIQAKSYPILARLGRVDSVKLSFPPRPESGPGISSSLPWKHAASSSKPVDKLPSLYSHRVESPIESVESPDVHIGDSGRRKILHLQRSVESKFQESRLMVVSL